MYSRFIFGDFKGKSTKERHIHAYGAFEGPLGSNPNDEFGWMSKLRIDQTRLVSKKNEESLNMVALLPRSSIPTLPPTTSLQKTDNDASQLIWDHMPSAFDLNFAAVDPDTRLPLPA